MNKEKLKLAQVEHIDDTYSQMDKDIKKFILLGVVDPENPLSWLRKLREKWFPFAVIFIATSSFIATELFGLNTIFGKKLPHPAGIPGALLALVGTLWTALGARLDKDGQENLQRMVERNELDVKEIVRMYKANSNFATMGAISIFLGTVFLIIDFLTT